MPLTPDEYEKMRDFHNRLRILSSIDFPELVQAGVLDHDAYPRTWLEFRENPWKWFIECADHQAETLWALLNKRSQKGDVIAQAEPETE